MNRWDIINEFLKTRTSLTKSYLEIGYYKGWSFDNVKEAQLKVAVDPNPCKTPEQQDMKEGDYAPADLDLKCISILYKKKSDDFFEMIHETTKFDVIFIDGLHEANQVTKDIHNSLKYLKPGGIIVMHDCNPPEYLHTTTGINGCWTGDTYKALIDFKMKHPEYESYVVDTDWGCGVIYNNPDPKKVIIDGLHSSLTDVAINSWEYFDRNRKNLLDLISVEEFKTKINERTEDSNSPA